MSEGGEGGRDRVRHVSVENDDGTEVTGLTAVIASSKDSDESAVMPILEAAQASGDLVRADAERE